MIKHLINNLFSDISDQKFILTNALAIDMEWNNLIQCATSGAGSGHCGFEHLYEVLVIEIDLTFDKPYLYIIRDKNTQETWVVGTVYQPIKNMR